MERSPILFAFAAVVSIVAASNLYADVPHLLNMQGLLTDDVGNPLDDGPYSVVFRIYNVSNGGFALWTETRNVVTTSGLFTIYLGQSNPIPASVFTGDDLWLGIAVEGEAEMTPRQQLTTVPFVYRAITADTSNFAFSIAENSVNSSKIADGSIQMADIGQNGAVTNQVMKWNGSAWTPADDEIGGGGSGGWVDDGAAVRLATTSDKVGIGTTNPQEKLHVEGDIRLGSMNDIAFGNDSTSIYATGGDLVVTADDDVHIQPDDDIYIRRDGGSAWVHFDNSSEKLGVGTTNPVEKLQVDGNIRLGASSSIQFGSYDNRLSSLSGDVFLSANDDLYLQPDDDIYIRQDGGSSWAHFDNSAGKLGLGTTNPAYRLTVNGTLSIANGGGSKYHINYYDGGLNFAETGVQDRRIHISDGGNVGIGTANPGAKLGVNGSLKVKGAYIGDISSSSGSDGAPFPRPAYNSGWRTLSAGSAVILTHNIGGDVNDYFVDLQMWATLDSIHSTDYGYEDLGNKQYGIRYHDLTSTKITVFRRPDDFYVEKYRIRIWVIE